MTDSGWNLPPGVFERDLPGWTTPDPVECDECGADVMPGEECEECGAYELSEDERAEAAYEQHVDRMIDERFLEGR